MSAEVKKIVLQLGKREIELTVAEAKELFKGLDELFGEKTVEHHYHRPWYWKPYEITWDSGTGSKWKFDNGVVYCSVGANWV